MKINVFKSQRIKNFIKDSSELLHYLNDVLISIFLRIKYFRKNTEKIKIDFLTASDTNFYNPLLNLLTSLNKYHPESNIKVYNLGLNQEQINFIINKFKNVKVFDFNFDRYPEFLSKRDEHDKLGSYAWKSSIIEENKNSENLILWMDSANLLTNNLNLLKLYLIEFGFYSPYSNGVVEDWTYIKTLNFLNTSKEIYTKRNLTGGVIGLDPTSDFGTSLIRKWYELCMIPECISPVGSSRENHRQDQSILSIIFHQERKNFYFRTKKIGNILVNQNPNQILYLYGSYEFDEYKKNWYKKNENISTNTVYKAEHILLLSPQLINKIPKKVQKKVSFIFFIENLKHIENKNLDKHINNKNLFICSDTNAIEYLKEKNIQSIRVKDKMDLERVVKKHIENL